MNTPRSEKTAPSPIQVDDALRSLTAGIGQLDGSRAAAYAELSTLRSAKQSSLDRRAQIYAVKYGADDRRVLQVQQQRESNTRLRQEIYVAHTQAATPAPAVDDNGYVFHGFVRNAQLQPLPRLTVALYDEKGQWRRELGYGCTDENGYFILSFARDAKSVVEERKKAADAEAAKKAADAAAAAAVEAQATGKSIPATPSTGAGEEKKIPVIERLAGIDREVQSATAEIRVYDRTQTLLHREARPLTPKLGHVDYREIIIDDGDERCVPPPGSTDDPPPPAPAKPAPASRIPAPTPTPPPPVAVVPPTPAPQPVPPARTSTPLENIKGVGRKTADKLRASGIKDIEALEATKTEKLVDLAGMDKKVTTPKIKKSVPLKAAPKKKKK